jgi:hypothetical protein
MTDPKPAKPRRPGWLINVAGSVLAGLLLVVFAVVVGNVLTTAADPPQLADPPATAAPQLYCAGVTTPTTPASAARSSSTSAPPTTTTTSSAAPTSGPATQQPVPSCPAGQLAYVPQLRGAFDVNARLTALLAVITPFLTTVIAFYFGQKAGTSDGKAQGRADMAQEIQARAQGPNPELKPFAAELVQRGETDPP